MYGPRQIWEVVKNSTCFELGLWQSLENVSDKTYVAHEEKNPSFTHITVGDDAKHMPDKLGNIQKGINKTKINTPT